eukprot:7997572-Karenia_brevis.AAC.1
MRIGMRLNRVSSSDNIADEPSRWVGIHIYMTRPGHHDTREEYTLLAALGAENIAAILHPTYKHADAWE